MFSIVVWKVGIKVEYVQLFPGFRAQEPLTNIQLCFLPYSHAILKVLKSSLYLEAFFSFA